MTASILTIGDEILIGQIIDTNSAWIGEKLNEVGVDVHHIVTVKDSWEGIRSGLDHTLKHSDLLIITGGLGPTHDDITKSVLADYFQDELVYNDAMYQNIVRLFEKFGREANSSHKEQCFLPAKAEILENKMGTAPGMLFHEGGKRILSMPGVPYEMKYIIDHHLLPLLKSEQKEQIQHRTIRTVGEGETRLAASFADITETIPDHIKLAFLPSLGQVRIRLSGRGEDEKQLAADLDHYQGLIEERVKPFVFGHDKTMLSEAVGQLAVDQGWMIATAESCTGGNIAKRITSRPGSSAYFKGSVVAYSNDMKSRLLNVGESTLEQYGAVSEEVVREMVFGALNLTKANLVVAVSGIAGPGGGTEEKPVGTIWLACGDGTRMETKRLSLTKDRLKNIDYTSTYALNMLRKFILTAK